MAYEDTEKLALVDERSASGHHIVRVELKSSTKYCLDIVGNPVDALYKPGSQDVATDALCPETPLAESTDKMTR